MIGIIGAMQVETDNLKRALTDEKEEFVSGMAFYSGRLAGQSVVLAKSGVGKVNAAMCAQTMILKYRPAAIINTGAAGGLKQGMGIGDIVIADAVVQYDVDTSAVGDPVGFVSGVNRIEFLSESTLADGLYRAAKALPDTGVHRGIIATGDRFIGSRAEAAAIRARFSALANDMEGGSIGQVCLINGVPFCAVRAISDSEGDDSHMEYAQFVTLAAQKSEAIVLGYLTGLGGK
ncbi:MAG TPA: 5'-methylthioadenosine/adenosylhomocysteine nucleosidase [Feifaniaceae bacterium]|nr:5'-methylthioadenosine/adenosylhomocysteine nucleosidase [Feifaniaceae bacterium]